MCDKNRNGFDYKVTAFGIKWAYLLKTCWYFLILAFLFKLKFQRKIKKFCKFDIYLFLSTKINDFHTKRFKF